LRHRWLKVEERKNERALPSEEKGEVKSRREPLVRILLSLLSDKGRGAGYIGEERKRERSCACTTGVGGSSSLVSCVPRSLFVVVAACGCMPWCRFFTCKWLE
jgi:hypothetical protein